jgi:hypothetical protein
MDFKVSVRFYCVKLPGNRATPEGVYIIGRLLKLRLRTGNFLPL